MALGHTWGMARWSTNDDRWLWQWNVEAMAFSRFELGGSVNSFETVDFFANLPVAARNDAFSARLMLFHESSHLGDDYIRRTADQGFRYSVDGLRGNAAWEPVGWARVYAGFGYLLHTIPSPDRRTLQAGFELTTQELGLSPRYPTRLFLAQDVQSHENAAWNLNSRTVAGVTVGSKNVRRFMRVFLGYFEGHSPYGQFFRRRERYLDLGLSLNL